MERLSKQSNKTVMSIRFLSSIIVICSLFLSIDSPANSRSDKVKPKWITQEVPTSKSGTYIFVSSHGQGSSIAGAKQQAFVAMAQRLEQERGLTVNTSLQISEKLSQNQSITADQFHQEIVLDVTEKGHQLKIVCREIDDYWIESNGRYDVDVLYSVTDKNSGGGSYEDEIIVTAKYGAAGFLSIIPGVGQMYKGSITKGCLILGGEIVAAGGVVLCENTRASYIKKMQEQPKHASEYNSLADTWETSRNICIGAAAAIYIYNLIDAFASNGAKHIQIKNRSISLSSSPYADDRSYGISLAFHF